MALVFHLLHSKEECVSYNQTHISTIILIKYFWWGGGIQFSYVNIRVVRLLAGLGQGQFTWSHEMMQNKLAPVVEVLGSSPSLFASTKLGRQRAGVASNLRAYRPSGRCAGLGIGDCHESPWQIPWWDPKISQRQDVVVHSVSTRRFLLIELTVLYERRMERQHVWKVV